MLKSVYKFLISFIVITIILLGTTSLPVKSELALVIMPNHSLQVVSTGGRIVGEVKNDGNREVTDITVTAKIKDSQGKLIDVQSVTLQSNMHWLFGRYLPSPSSLHFMLKPSMTIPFRINLISEEVYPNAKSYELSVTGQETAGKPSNLKLIEANAIIDSKGDIDNDWKVIGEIRNEGNQPTHNVTIIASLFNKDNVVVGVAGYTFVDTPIAEIKTGESVAFGLEPTSIPKEQEVVKVNIYAESLEYSMISESIPTVTTPEIPAEKISSSNMQVVDQLGSSINDISVGQQVVLQSSIKNNVDIDQKFAYIMQIKDSDNITIMIAWINGEIPKGKTFDIGLSWIPDNSGTYKVDVFVWESVGKPVPLSFKPLSTSITVT